MTETDTIIVHRGRKFYVREVEPSEHVSKWRLEPVSGRGRSYALLRNVPRPHMLFAIAVEARGSKTDSRAMPFSSLPGWFTDKDGELKSLG